MSTSVASDDYYVVSGNTAGYVRGRQELRPTRELPTSIEEDDDKDSKRSNGDFTLGLVYSLIINSLFALGVIAIFYVNRVPQWLWLLFIVKQLLAIPIYVAMDFTLGNLGKVGRGTTAAGIMLIVGLVTLQIVLKSVVVHYSAQYTRIPQWVWSFSSFASIILILLTSLGKYQEELASSLDVPLPAVNMAVRAAILANLALFSASTIALAVYGNQSWTTGLFILVVIIQLSYAFKSYLVPDAVIKRAKALRDKLEGRGATQADSGVADDLFSLDGIDD